MSYEKKEEVGQSIIHLFLILGGHNIFNIKKMIYDIINDISREDKCWTLKSKI